MYTQKNKFHTSFYVSTLVLAFSLSCLTSNTSDKRHIRPGKYSGNTSIGFRSGFMAGTGALGGGFFGFTLAALLAKRMNPTSQPCLYIPVHGPFEDKHMYLRWIFFGAAIGGTGMWLLSNQVSASNSTNSTSSSPADSTSDASGSY